MDTTVRAVAAGLLLFLVFLTGIWLSRKGRPLNMGISTLHKLVGLAAGALLLVTIYQRNGVVPLNETEWIAIVVTGLCFLGTVISGALLTSEDPRPVAVLRVHLVVPVQTVLSSGATLYLLLGL